MAALDPVTQEFIAEVGRYVSGLQAAAQAARDFADANAQAIRSVEELQVAIDALHGKDIEVKVNVDAPDLLKGVGVTGITATISAASLKDASDAAASLSGNLAAAGVATSSLSRRFTNLSAKSAVLTAALKVLDTEVDSKREALAALGIDTAAITTAMVAMAAAAAKAGDGTAGAGAAATAAAGGFRIFGIGLTGLHWIVMGTAELLAVTVPAAIALASGAFVMYQGVVEQVGRRMSATYTATEATANAFGKTAGDVLGVGHAFQTAQNQANPLAWELLGSAVNMARQHTVGLATAGLQVAGVFDRFAARVNLDMQGAFGGQIQGILSHMVTDLTQLGQIFGNLGHLILNLASDMPGLAEALLRLIDTFTHILVLITDPNWYNFNGKLVEIAVGMEEVFRWGGLLLGLLVKLTGQTEAMNALNAGNFITKFGAAFVTLIGGVGRGIAALGTWLSYMRKVDGVAMKAGTALFNLGSSIEKVGTLSASAGAGIAAAVAALVILVVWYLRAKSATQQWAAQTQQAVQNANALQVIPKIYSELNANTIKLNASQTRLNQVTHNFSSIAGAAGSGGHMLGLQMQWASNNTQVLTQNQLKLVGTLNTVSSNVNFLAQHFHITAAAALELANMAGVKLQAGLMKGTTAGKLAVQQINNLERGMGIAGQQSGVLNTDIVALGIQSQLAGTKVQQLNQAWDQWIQNVTGAMSALSSVETALSGMQNSFAATSASITGHLSSIRMEGTKTQYTLQGFGQKAMQSWQQFTGAITSGNSALDVLRTGMAEGVVSSGLFQTAVKGLVGQMAPFTQGNKAAVEMLSNLAHEAGGPVTTNLKTLEHWAGVTGKTARDQFVKAMETASIKMGDMSKVAQNLAAVVGQQLDTAFAQAALKASDLNQAYLKYAQDVASGHASQATLHRDLVNIHDDMGKLNTIMAAGKNAVAGFGNQSRSSAGQVTQMKNAVIQLHDAINNLHSKTITITTKYLNVGGSTATGLVGHRITGGQHGGIIPGYQPGVDSVPALLSPGEGILNPWAVRMLGHNTIHQLNNMAERGGGANPPALRTTPFGGQGDHDDRRGGRDLVVHVDGRELFRVMAYQGYKYDIRNSGKVTGLMKPS